MKNTIFKTLTDSDKRARLISILTYKTAGKLSKAELKEIVDNINISQQYSISILQSEKTKYHCEEHSLIIYVPS